MCLCGLYSKIKDVYVNLLMKVCFAAVFTPMGPAACHTVESIYQRSSGEDDEKRKSDLPLLSLCVCVCV